MKFKELASLNPGESWSEPIVRRSDRAYIIADTTVAVTIFAGGPCLELIALGMEHRLEEYEFKTSVVNTDTLTLEGHAPAGSQEMVDRGAIRMSADVALGAAAALLEQGLKTSLFTRDAVRARLRASGIVE